MHQAKSQCGIRARQDRQVGVATLGRLGAAGVNADQLGALAFRRLRVTPKVQVTTDGVTAPNDDELAVSKRLNAHTHRCAIGVGQGGRARGGANGAVKLRCPQPIKEARRNGLALYQAHGACIAVGQNRLRISTSDRFQTIGNVIQRLIP